MIKKIKNLSFTFSSKALLSVVPTVVLFRILEFRFFSLFTSKTYCYCSPVILSKKEKRYINFRVLLTRVELFNSFLCKTTYSELLKELFNYYTNILSLFKRNPLKILVFDYLLQPRVDSKFNSFPATRIGVFIY